MLFAIMVIKSTSLSALLAFYVHFHLTLKPACMARLMLCDLKQRLTDSLC